MAKTSLVYGVSLVLHGALAIGVIGLGKEKRVETIAISMSEAKKKEKPPEPAKVTEEPKQPEAKTEAPRQTKAKVAAPKVLGPKPVDECTEALVKPKIKLQVQPRYTGEGAKGAVRVEVSVSADGSVTGAHLLSGLGSGADDASVEAARHFRFDPATRCGKPVAGTKVLKFTFNQ